MDSLVFMGESLCRVDPDVSLHLTVPDAPDMVRAWARTRPQVVLSTVRPEGVTGWDVKPWLLLKELDEGAPEVLWLDDDMIVMRPISSLIKEFPRDSLIVAEEWDATQAPPFHRFWGLPFGRTMPMINACVLRATPAHRPLLERYLQMTHDPRYREAQTIPIASRPVPVLGDTPLLVALLESKEFSGVSFDYLRMGRHIAQCAGSFGYRPQHRLIDLFRGFPALIHGIGRKPWDATPDGSRIQRYLFDLATDVSPYVLAARKVAIGLNMHAGWLETRTLPGAMLRELTGGHPGMAGLPLAIPHAVVMKMAAPAGGILDPASDASYTGLNEIKKG